MPEKKYIRFIDSRYHTLFHLPDGGRVRLTRSDGTQIDRVCKYVDECHTYVGNYLYHICEFAERMEANSTKYEPLDYIAEPEFYPRRYLTPVTDAVRPPYYIIAETPHYGFAYAPKGAQGKRYGIFEKLPGDHDTPYRIGEVVRWGGSLKDMRPKDWGFQLEKIKAVTGRKPKVRQEPER